MTHPHYRIWPYVLVLAIAMLAGLAALDAKQSHDARAESRHDAWALYDASLESCVRGNVIRQELHRLAAAQRVTAATLASFLTTSAEFRRSQGQEKLARESEAAASLLAEVAGRLSPPLQVRCADILVRPLSERPSP